MRNMYQESVLSNFFIDPHEQAQYLRDVFCECQRCDLSLNRHMNFGILNNKGPQKEAALSASEVKYEKAYRHAKSMGLDLKDFDGVARGIWDRLNDLSRSDPEGYRIFLQEHLQDDVIGTCGSEKELMGSFFPRPGYVIKCHCLQTGESHPVKLFLNICTHEAIDRPINPNSEKSVPDDPYKVPVTNSLRIPLLVGPPRMFCDTPNSRYQAVDVVFNSWVTSRCEWDQTFKREVLKLAIEWVQNDAGLTITSTPKFIKCQYKGGIRTGKDIITAKIRVDKSGRAIDTSDNNRRENVESAIADTPADLLKRLQNAKDNDTNASTMAELHLGVKDDSDRKSVSHKPSIEIVESSTPIDSLSRNDFSKCRNEDLQQITRSSKKHLSRRSCYKTTKSDSVIQKGFLNLSTDPKLYTSGSKEGRKSSAFVNLMSQSKVIDLSQPKSSEKDMGDLYDIKESYCVSDNEFEQLCHDADPELANDDFETYSQSGFGGVFQAPFQELSHLLHSTK
uniref:Uncharacterized protein AlNc14C604G12230 n=1 Tax=Albugo laibachii Nc14 TaxID=890382 RepID=F0X1D9_9STRA|nr:conserved hypothetical protein [Albugo laibachii Nc14]|eukprot:CCA27617.1 conserved hypothetical protein [Albugo laibachii Nc14]